MAPVAVTVAALLSQGSLLSRILLSNPASVFIGRISYPFYLWHWPLLVFGKAYPLRTLSQLDLVGLVVLAFALAWLTFEFIERPVRSGRFAAGTNTSIAGMAVTAACAVALLAMPPRVPDEIQRLINTPNGNEGPEWRSHECFLTGHDGKNDFAAKCVEPERPLIAIWGDSTVAALMPGLREQQLTRHFALAQFTNGRSCQPVLVRPSETDDCLELNRAILRRLSEVIPDTVLLGGLWRANTSELKPTIDTLRAIGVRRIIILGKVPIWGIGLPDLVAAYYRLKRKLLPDFSSLLLELRPDAELKSAAATLGVDFISIYDILCKNGECRTRIGDDVMAGDRDHFTPAGSKYVVGKMANDVLPEKQSTGEMSKPPTNAN
jgi:hypothetical protein